MSVSNNLTSVHLTRQRVVFQGNERIVANMAVVSFHSDCGRCLKQVVDGGKWLFCGGFCAKTNHAKCVSVSDKDYSAINKLSDVVL